MGSFTGRATQNRSPGPLQNWIYREPQDCISYRNGHKNIAMRVFYSRPPSATEEGEMLSTGFRLILTHLKNRSFLSVI